MTEDRWDEDEVEPAHSLGREMDELNKIACALGNDLDELNGAVSSILRPEKESPGSDSLSVALVNEPISDAIQAIRLVKRMLTRHRGKVSDIQARLQL